MGYLKKHMHTIIVVLVVWALTAIGPAVAHGVQHALFAHDAGAVDGKSAVSSSATKSARAGKLVATNAEGTLPNNIIAMAPNADRLDGKDWTDFLLVGSKAADSELLDGQEATAFAAAGHNHDASYYTKTLADARYAPISHNHDGVYYATGSKVADSELLDGVDGSSYLKPGSVAGGALAGTYPNPTLKASEAWREVGAAGQPPFQNDWSNYGFGTTTAAFYKDPLGIVHLKGHLSGGSGIMFTMPAGYRPLQNWEGPALVAVGGSTMSLSWWSISPTGTVFINTSGGFAYVTLDGITFRAEA